MAHAADRHLTDEQEKVRNVVDKYAYVAALVTCGVLTLGALYLGVLYMITGR